MAQDEFVDLYKVLDVPPESDAAALKKRISEKYLEAQQNLDHRNAKKRLAFQQMYEIYLPQARHLLLDAGHRAEYDRYLKAFLSGKSVAEIEPATAAPVEAVEAVSGMPGTDDDSFKDMDAKAADPKKLAEQREQLWNKWKTGLETGFTAAAPVPTPQSSVLDNVPSVDLHAATAGDSNAALPSVSATPGDPVPPTVSITPAAAPGTSGTMYSPATAAAAPAAPRREARRSWAAQGGANSGDEADKRHQEEQERDRRLHEVAVQKAESARKSFALISGLAFLVVVGLVYMFMLMDVLANFLGNLLPGGMGFALSNFVGPLLVLVGAYFFAKFAGQYGYDSTLAASRPAPAPLPHSGNRPRV